MGSTRLHPSSAHDALSAHIAILDEHGIILEVNTAWQRFARDNGLVGDSYGVGGNYLALCDAACGESADEASVTATGIRNVLSGQCEGFQLEYPCDAPDEKRWFALRVARFTADGLMRLVVAHENITVQKQAKEVLEANERRLQMALRAGGLGAFEHTPGDGRITVSPEFCQIVGLPLKASISHDEWIEQMHADDRGFVLAAVQRMRSEQVALDLEYRLCFPKGIVRWIRAMASNTVEPGKVERVYGVVQDITQRKELAERKETEERSRRALEREHVLRQNHFVAMVSHEFRTPLGVINTAAHLLGRYWTRMGVEERAAQVGEIRGSVARMTLMMEDLLIHGEFETGKAECRPVDVHVETLCRQLLLDTSKNFGTSNLIDCRIDPAAREAFVDGKILHHILANLLSNAVKYSLPGHSVGFDVRKVAGNAAIDADTRISADDHLQLTVSDSGIGIPAADLSRLFGSFHRAANVGERPGSGMGLAIVKKCVDLHRGAVRIESALGKGTSVRVWLPIASADKTEPVREIPNLCTKF